jgi:PKD domain/S-layer homology domain
VADGWVYLADIHWGLLIFREYPSGPLRAAFSGSPVGGPAPLAVTFGDASPGAPTEWAWDFGDGGTSSEQSPTHIYTSLGYYDVSLTASSAAGSDAKTKVGMIAVGFPDTPLTNCAFYEIVACADAGIVSGFPSGDYGPERPVTRGQMAIYIARAIASPTGEARVPDPPEGTQTFPDVPPTNPAWKYVEYCYDQNVVKGYPGGQYKPDLPVDRGHMAIYIANAMVAPRGAEGLPGADPDYPVFPDVLSDQMDWCYRQVQYLGAMDPPVVGGYPDHNYHPERMVRRDQMALYVARGFGLMR